MKKSFLGLTLLLAIFSSCNNEDSNIHCAKVQYLTEYCSEDKPLHLVRFLKSNSYATSISDRDSISYLAAIIDLPKNVQKTDTTFYLSFHYDKSLAKNHKPKICQAMFTSVNILVYDMTTNDPCLVPL